MQCFHMPSVKFARGFNKSFSGETRSLIFFQSWVGGLKDAEKIKQFETLFAKYIDRKYCVSFPFARSSNSRCFASLQNLPKGI